VASRDGLDAGGIRDAEQIGVADREDDEVARVLCGEAGALEVMLRGDVILQRGDVDQVLGEVGAKVDDLEWSDDRRETGKLQSVGGKIDLLDLNAGRAGDGRQKRLQLLKTLAVRVLLRGGLQDQAKILTKSALDSVIQREIEHAVGRLAGNHAALEGVLRRLRVVLP